MILNQVKIDEFEKGFSKIHFYAGELTHHSYLSITVLIDSDRPGLLVLRNSIVHRYFIDKQFRDTSDSQDEVQEMWDFVGMMLQRIRKEYRGFNFYIIESGFGIPEEEKKQESYWMRAGRFVIKESGFQIKDEIRIIDVNNLTKV